MKAHMVRRVAWTGLMFLLATTPGCGCQHSHDTARASAAPMVRLHFHEAMSDDFRP